MKGTEKKPVLNTHNRKQSGAGSEFSHCSMSPTMIALREEGKNDPPHTLPKKKKIKMILYKSADWVVWKLSKRKTQ